MPSNQNERGVSHEQHVKAGQKSHKNMDRSKSTNPSGSTGRGWHGDPQGHAEAGRVGGEAVSRDRQHMAEIGRKGGEAVSKDRQHMAQIGREGGEARGGSHSSAGTSRGGSHVQQVKAGRQSHKNS